MSKQHGIYTAFLLKVQNTHKLSYCLNNNDSLRIWTESISQSYVSPFIIKEVASKEALQAELARQVNGMIVQFDPIRPTDLFALVTFLHIQDEPIVVDRFCCYGPESPDEQYYGSYLILKDNTHVKIQTQYLNAHSLKLSDDFILFDDLIAREGNFCGGPNACENRKYDETKKDCQDCLSDANQACEDSLT